jgi:hypothetical protein
MKCRSLTFVAICATSFFVMLLSGCRQQKHLKARIFERKQTEDGKLLIRYQYVIDSTLFTDSVMVKNVILTNDSLNLTIDPVTSKRWIPDLKY